MNQVWPRHTMRTMSLQTAQAAGFTRTERTNRLSRDYPLAELMAENNFTAYALLNCLARAYLDQVVSTDALFS